MVVVLELYCAWKFAPTAISGVVSFPEVPACHLSCQMSSKKGPQKLLPRISVSSTDNLLFSFYRIFLMK